LTYAQNPGCGASINARLSSACYKTNSARKWLNLLGIFFCSFYGHSSPGLDFWGFRATRRGSINKVIHRKLELVAKGFKFKDLSDVSQFSMKTAC
jgi:hypothetical protein